MSHLMAELTGVKNAANKLKEKHQCQISLMCASGIPFILFAYELELNNWLGILNFTLGLLCFISMLSPSRYVSSMELIIFGCICLIVTYVNIRTMQLLITPLIIFLYMSSVMSGIMSIGMGIGNID